MRVLSISKLHQENKHHLLCNSRRVSYHRLRQEFYGLPPDANLLRERLIKEALHETGHTLALTHCEDYECVMAPSHAIEWLDLKESAFCPECAAHMRVVA